MTKIDDRYAKTVVLDRPPMMTDSNEPPAGDVGHEDETARNPLPEFADTGWLT